MDPKIKEMAYQAWLGYYRSVKGMALDKKKLVEYANQFSFSMGLAEPPALERKLLLKMNLLGVPGIRVY
jgi:ATP-dependent RNA helicase MSS116